MPIVIKGGGISVTPTITGADPPSPKGVVNGRWKRFNFTFDRDAFAQLVSDARGTEVLWEKSQPCPNVSPIDGIAHHDFSCNLCDAFGRIYIDPQQTLVGIQSIDLKQSYNQETRIDTGTAKITPMPEFRMSEGDRLTITHAVDRFEEKLLRQPNSLIDRTKYPVVSTLEWGTPSPSGVINVLWKNRLGALVSFTQGVHFNVTVGGDILWLSSAAGAAPDAHTYYTIAYHFHPRYIVIPDLLHQFRLQPYRDKEFEFPVQVLARFEYLMRDESRDARQAEYTNPIPQR
jgi:hypothetical protein